jgi:hypothetical protein
MKKNVSVIISAIGLLAVGLIAGVAIGYYYVEKSDGSFLDNKPGKTSAFDKIFAVKPNSLTKDRRICRNFADGCVALFRQNYSNRNFNINDLIALKTTSVNFGSKNIYNWIDDVVKNTNADSIKVTFGSYTEDIIKAFPQNLSIDKKGRLTVFLYATYYNTATNKIETAKYKTDSTYPRTEPDGCIVVSNEGAKGTDVEPFNLAGIDP